jgi:hypothetical protein
VAYFPVFIYLFIYFLSFSANIIPFNEAGVHVVYKICHVSVFCGRVADDLINAKEFILIFMNIEYLI